MNIDLSHDIDSFISENKDSIIKDIASLVSINSVCTDAEEGAPFGKGAADCLKLALEISERMGLSTRNCEDMIGYAEVGDGSPDCTDYLATITHLDVVPAEGWANDPFTLREKDGYLIGRGVLDDKGPSVICLYALKYFKDRGIKLRYPIRALLGINEEVGMEDVEHYLANYPAPLFCFSPDADFPLCNGEKGILHGMITATTESENVISIKGGLVSNAIPDSAKATVKAGELHSTEWVTAEKNAELWVLTARGIGGHASMPEGTVNAIGKLIDYLLDNNIPSAKERPFYETLALLHAASDGSALGVDAKDDFFKPLTIIGGTIGMKDGRVWQSFDSRYPTSTSGETIVQRISEKAGGSAVVIPGTSKAPFYMSIDKPEVQVCIDAYNSVTGENAKPYTIGGGTYARVFPNAVSFGPEHPERPMPDFAGPIHGVDETACTKWLLEALKIYIIALSELEKLDF